MFKLIAGATEISLSDRKVAMTRDVEFSTGIVFTSGYFPLSEALPEHKVTHRDNFIIQYTMKLNKLGVKNSLVNNINAKKKSGTSKPKSENTVSDKDYKKMKKWGK